MTKLMDPKQLSARALPRMDEDNRLSPILTHLSKSFTAPDANYSADASSIGDTTAITAGTIDALSQHFPLCMQNLHRELRKNSHLKHYGRLQYTLFLKGLGMEMNECIVFWRQAFKLVTDGASITLPHLSFFFPLIPSSSRSSILVHLDPPKLTSPFSSCQKSSKKNTRTTSATPTATSAATQTAEAKATRPTRAKNS